jgi:hypothetical protein
MVRLLRSFVILISMIGVATTADGADRAGVRFCAR